MARKVILGLRMDLFTHIIILILIYKALKDYLK